MNKWKSASLAVLGIIIAEQVTGVLDIPFETVHLCIIAAVYMGIGIIMEDTQ